MSSELPEKSASSDESVHTIGSRARRLVENSIARLASLIASIIIIVTAILYLWNVAHQRTWQEKTNSRLGGLQALYQVNFFKQRLGEPIFIRRAQIAQEQYGAKTLEAVVEYTFRGRGWWVQVIAGGDGTALQYAVTSCDPDLKVPILAPAGVVRVTLQGETLADVQRDVVRRHGGSHLQAYFYSLPGTMSTNAHIFDFYAGGEQSTTNFQKYAVGVDNICPAWDTRTRSGKPIYRFLDENFDRTGVMDANRVWNRTLKRDIAGIRPDSIVNTYVETAPFNSFFVNEFPGSLGADDIFGRTLVR